LTWGLVICLLAYLQCAASEGTIRQPKVPVDPATLEVDPNGYVVFCPCMGRFGNQLAQYLGALYFAKRLDRTLVLAPFVTYPPGTLRSVQVSFDEYFKPEEVAKYHRSIMMQDFMSHLAPKIWAAGNRTAFCYSKSQIDKPLVADGCRAREGNPFDSFWATFDISFDNSVHFEPLYFDVQVDHVRNRWLERYPADKHPILAFTGAPSPFPISSAVYDLQRYFVWNDEVVNKAEKFMEEKITKPFVAIHLRNDLDWPNVCNLVQKSPNQHYFDSRQCLGDNFERGKLTAEICGPTEQMIVKQVASIVKKIGAKSVYVGTDKDDLKGPITSYLKKMKLNAYVTSQGPADRNKADVHMDLYIMAQSDYFIGNCMSTFSSIPVRERVVNGKGDATEFFGVPKDKSEDEIEHSEL